MGMCRHCVHLCTRTCACVSVYARGTWGGQSGPHGSQVAVVTTLVCECSCRLLFFCCLCVCSQEPCRTRRAVGYGMLRCCDCPLRCCCARVGLCVLWLHTVYEFRGSKSWLSWNVLCRLALNLRDLASAYRALKAYTTTSQPGGSVSVLCSIWV